MAAAPPLPLGGAALPWRQTPRASLGPHQLQHGPAGQAGRSEEAPRQRPPPGSSPAASTYPSARLSRGASQPLGTPRTLQGERRSPGSRASRFQGSVPKSPAPQAASSPAGSSPWSGRPAAACQAGGQGRGPPAPHRTWGPKSPCSPFMPLLPGWPCKRHARGPRQNAKVESRNAPSSARCGVGRSRSWPCPTHCRRRNLAQSLSTWPLGGGGSRKGSGRSSETQDSNHLDLQRPNSCSLSWDREQVRQSQTADGPRFGHVPLLCSAFRGCFEEVFSLKAPFRGGGHNCGKGPAVSLPRQGGGAGEKGADDAAERIRLMGGGVCL